MAELPLIKTWTGWKIRQRGRLRKFSKVECRVQHLGRNDLVHQDIPRVEKLGSSSPMESLESWGTTSWSEASNATSKQRRPRAPRAALERMCLAVLSAASFPPAQHQWIQHNWNAMSGSGLPSTRHWWTAVGEGSLLRGWEGCGCPQEEEAQGVLVICINTW